MKVKILNINEKFVKTINKVTDSGIQYNVHRFDGFSWTKIGELSQAHATSYAVNSGKIVNGYAFVGAEYFKKASLTLFYLYN